MAANPTAPLPALITDGLNGRPVVQFGGYIEEGFARANVPAGTLSSATAVDIFVVQRAALEGSSTVTWNYWRDDCRINIHAPWHGSLIFQHGPAAQGIAGTAPANFLGSWNLVEMVRTDTTGEILINGQSLVSATISSPLDTTLSGSLTVGYDSYGNRYKGDIAEIIIYNRALDASERAKVNEYLTSKYSPSTAVPDTSSTASLLILSASALILGARRTRNEARTPNSAHSVL